MFSRGTASLERGQPFSANLELAQETAGGAARAENLTGQLPGPPGAWLVAAARGAARQESSSARTGTISITLRRRGAWRDAMKRQVQRVVTH
jgi:hypothetical protein